VGNTTREMSQERLRALLLKEKSWDVATGSQSMDEIDVEAIRAFLRRAIGNGRLPHISADDPPEALLGKLDGLVDGRPANGAIMLFGKDPGRRFLNASIRIGRFKTETEIIDDKWVKGNLFRQFEEAQKLLMQHIAVRYEIIGPERTDIWEYPIPVLREALLNAIVHRDYRDAGNFIQIKVYDDRIWFANPGGLPEGMTIEGLRKPHKSCLRNPLIAKVFYLAGYIEQFGSGTLRMIDGMRASGLPEPEFREDEGGFSVYLRKGGPSEDELLAAGLNERQVKAVLEVQKTGRITNQGYRRLTGVGRTAAVDDLDALVKKGILARIGRIGKGTYYVMGTTAK
jgi:ATP-dependent DNA helicase RecG